MLEKIGLPAKPSLRGNNWVIDASHCQGCSSQFTFINRKHHCRRCGGIFCSSCTQQRMILRGQGDSPVRICDPCKNLEEAARFELRHGHKNRAGRGGLKLMRKDEDEVLNQILGTDGKEPILSGRESITDVVSNYQRATSTASSSAISLDREGDLLRTPSLDMHDHAPTETGSASPDELRQQALEQKKKYRTLKTEGKPEEALRAFKRAKELERQAGALEVALRKNRRKALSSSNLADINNIKDEPRESGRKNKLSSQMGKEEKDDLSAELRELGWSDADQMPAKVSLEGELSSLLGEIPQKSNLGKGISGIDKTQVLAHKKKALMFKREGMLAEAKEELKKAKILEKQLEEQEFLAVAEDSDDELSSLIRSMDDDDKHDLTIGYGKDMAFDFGHLSGVADDLGSDGNFEVTDEDMVDPEIAAVLNSFGWTEDTDQREEPHSISMGKEALLDEVLSLKKEALNKKRTGNVAEAMAQLKKAKLLERELERLQFQENSSSAPTHKGSISLTAEESSKSINLDGGTFGSLQDVDPKQPPKSKLMIQKELLSLKKKALVLRREGRLDEAEEELKKGRVLEHQLEEMENASKAGIKKANIRSKDSELAYEHPDISAALALGDGDVSNVTDDDMHDPILLSMLRNLERKSEDIEPESLPSGPKQIGDHSAHTTYSGILAPSEIPAVASKSKAEIQRELLGLKRKALTLRRQGQTEEAEEVLRMAKLLEAQVEEMEVPKKMLMGDFVKGPDGRGSLNAQDEQRTNIWTLQENETIKPPPRSSLRQGDEEHVTEQDMHDPAFLSVLKNMGWKDENVEPVSTATNLSKQIVNRSEHATDQSMQASSDIPVVAPRSKVEIQRELLGLKRKALTLRRQGETEEAEEVLRMAKLLEVKMEEMEVSKTLFSIDPFKVKEPEVLGSFSAHEKHGNVNAVSEINAKEEEAELAIGLSQKESIASKLPRRSSAISIPETSESIEGKTTLIAELGPPADRRTVEKTGLFPQSGQSVNIVDFLTGDDWKSSQLPVEELENKRNFNPNVFPPDNPPIQRGTSKSPYKETGSIDKIISETREADSSEGSNSPNSHNSPQQEILTRKRKAVALKREGKLAEAREELRQAKLLEKSLKEDIPQSDIRDIFASSSTSNDTSVGQEERRTTKPAPKPMSSRDRFKLQQESLAHKRQAMKLRREGRIEEADAEFKLAKALENQLEELAGHDLSDTDKSNNETEAMDDVGIEDFLDPQLLSALKAIGLQDVDSVLRAPERSDTAKLKSNVGKSENSSQMKSQLEEQIKAEKIKALNLKRAGKQSEALDALRLAKQLEKKLNSLPS